MNTLFTASSSIQLQEKVTLIKTTALRTYKTTFILNLIIRYKQYGSAGETSLSKVHVAPRGSPVPWDKELLILVGSATAAEWSSSRTTPVLVALPVLYRQANQSGVPMSARSVRTAGILKSKTSTFLFICSTLK